MRAIRAFLAGAVCAAFSVSFGCGEDSVKCPGAVNPDGTCAPLCGPGSAWDPTSRACVWASDLVCNPGSLWSISEGKCVFPIPDIVTVENDDPGITGGEPGVVPLPDIGSTLMVGGNVDGQHDGWSDWDFFQFDATAGQLIRFEATSVGDPSPAFVVLPADQYTKENPSTRSPSRFGFDFDGNNPVRYIRIYETTTYFLVVSDFDNLLGHGLTGGSEGFGYLVAITPVEPPADVALTLDVPVEVDATKPTLLTIEGLDPSRVYEFTVADPTFPARRELILEDGAGTIEAVFYDSPTAFGLRGIGRNFVTNVNSLKLALDFKYFWTGAPKDSAITVRDAMSAGSIQDLGTVSSDVAPPLAVAGGGLFKPWDVQLFAITPSLGAAPTSLLHLEPVNRYPDFPPSIIVTDENFSTVSSINFYSGGDFNTVLSADIVISKSRRYYVWVTASSSLYEWHPGGVLFDFDARVVDLVHHDEETADPHDTVSIDPFGNSGLPFAVHGTMPSPSPATDAYTFYVDVAPEYPVVFEVVADSRLAVGAYTFSLYAGDDMIFVNGFKVPGYSYGTQDDQGSFSTTLTSSTLYTLKFKGVLQEDDPGYTIVIRPEEF
jgi:hypothetical protein